MKRVSFYLCHFEQPPKVIKTTTESLCFFVEGDKIHVDQSHKETEGSFKLCTLDFDPSKNEKAVILKVALLYSHNEREEPVVWKVNSLFKTEEEEEEDGRKSIHPDATGKITIVLPGMKFKGPLEENDRLIYEPKLVHLDIPILPYIGMEHYILGARSTCVTQQGIAYEYQAFLDTDPFMVFLLQHKNHFDEVNAYDIKMGGGRVYLVKRSLVKRIQQFFKNAIFPLIRYVEDPIIYFKWNNPQIEEKGIFINAMIQVDYVVVSPEIAKYKTQGTLLDI